MNQTQFRGRWVWLAAGVLLGIALSAYLPDAPLHAVATATQDNLIVATGAVDGDGEAVYVLDTLTGDLKAWVLGPTSGKFEQAFLYNILNDLNVDVSKGPKYVVVTGTQNFRLRAGSMQMANSVVYVAELTSGRLAAYALPWNRGIRGVPQPKVGTFMPLDMVQFRNVLIREP